MLFIFYRCGSRTDAGKTWSRARRNRAGTVLAAARTTPRRARPLSSPPASSPASWTRWTTTAPTTSNPARTRAGRWPTTDTSPTPSCHRLLSTIYHKNTSAVRIVNWYTVGITLYRTRARFHHHIRRTQDIPMVTQMTHHVHQHQSAFKDTFTQSPHRTWIQSHRKQATQRRPIIRHRSTIVTRALHTTLACSYLDTKLHVKS